MALGVKERKTEQHAKSFPSCFAPGDAKPFGFGVIPGARAAGGLEAGECVGGLGRAPSLPSELREQERTGGGRCPLW